MEHLFRGLMNFKEGVAPRLRPLLEQLAHGQDPELLLFSCCDSRVVPHLITSEEPGEVFVVRSVGNIVAPADEAGSSVGDVSEASAIEYALEVLGIRDIAVCGHSNCGAMKALAEGREHLTQTMPNLARWLSHADASRQRLELEPGLDRALSLSDQLSQANVLQQLAHVSTFTPVKRLLAKREVRLHALWFDIATAMVSLYEADSRRFVALDEVEMLRLLSRGGAPPPTR